MSDGIDDRIERVLAQYPFLSFGSMLDVPYLGIVQNCDSALISIYVLTLVPTHEQRVEFCRLGSVWWWESNRTIPINIFLGDPWKQFRPYLKHFSRKDFNLASGPIVSLQETIARRYRKRQVTLVRRPEA